MDDNYSIEKESISLQVTNALREAIVAGRYRPGEKLSEALLSEKFGISRTPVREALKQLQREGLVEIISRVGTCVSKPTQKELFELFTVKESLEGLAAALLAEHGDVPALSELEEAFSTMEQCVEKEEIDGYIKANSKFHDAIMRGSDNSKLQFHFNLLINQIPYTRYVYLSLEQPNRVFDSLEEHRLVVEAIKSGDMEKAERAMRAHVKSSGQQLRQGIADKLLK